MNVQPVRRFVTSDDDQGRSRVVMDAPTDHAFVQEGRPVALTDLWRMHAIPTSLDVGAPAPDGSFSLAPPTGGLVFRAVQFDPGNGDRAVDPAVVFQSMGAAGSHAADPEHPFMHRTATVDFGIVLHGSITMVLDLERVELTAGDIVIQRGTNHEWRNEGNEPCTVLFVLVDAR
jgi:mannose-6-phosphate isomerase-like protein (cupin superfamily)